MPELQAGDPAWIGPFRLRERLGDGHTDGHADVHGGDGALGPLYLGQSPLAHLVAIRILRADLAADKALRARLTRDVAAAREVTGPHVAPLVGADLSGSAPWVAWEWVPGESLAATVGTRGPLPWPAFAALATALADGMWSMHEAGVVHGNLTPASVFLAKDGPSITGFGVSAAVAALRAAAGAAPADASEFLAPEQAARGAASPAGDMFSLGAVLNYALRGTGPFTRQLRAGQRIDYGQPDLDGIPDFLRPLIARCLRADPAARPPSGGFAALIATTIRAVPARVIAAWTRPPKVSSPTSQAPAVPSHVHPATTAAWAAPAAATPPPPMPAPATRPAGRAASAMAPGTRKVMIGTAVVVAAVVLLIGVISLVGQQPSPPAAVAPATATVDVPQPPVQAGTAPPAVAVPAGATQVHIADYRVGDCLIGDAMVDFIEWPDPMWRVPCADIHNYEVFYANFRYWPANERFPGYPVTSSYADATCSARLASYESPAARHSWRYTFTYITPDEANWGNGDREVVCVAYYLTTENPNGEPVRGSVRSASASPGA